MTRSGAQPAPEDGDSWVLAEGEIDGHRVLCRHKSVRPDPSRPVKITVKVGFADPRPDGWPGPSDLDALEAIEETLVTEFESFGAELVLVVTANNAREFVAYAATHDWLEQWGPTVTDRWSQGRPGTGLEAILEEDWETFRWLTAGPLMPR
jgi:Family of unknown function (DUF695)